MLQNRQQWKPRGQVSTDRLGRPDLEPLAMLPQQQQADRMIDLPIDQQHGGDRRIADPGARLKARIGGDLAMQIGRRIAKYPSIAIARDRHRGLSSGGGLYGTIAHPAAVLASAIPLRKAP